MSRFASPFPNPDALPQTTPEAMADALVDAHAAKGFAELNDLVVLGRWSARQIDQHGPDAVALAGRRATRQVVADWRAPAAKAA